MDPAPMSDAAASVSSKGDDGALHSACQAPDLSNIDFSRKGQNLSQSLPYLLHQKSEEEKNEAVAETSQDDG